MCRSQAGLSLGSGVFCKTVFFMLVSHIQSPPPPALPLFSASADRIKGISEHTGNISLVGKPTWICVCLMVSLTL